jgi:sec-independent protein translocase protein TatA
MGIFGNAFTGWHLLAVLAIVLLLFGATRLPALAKSVGQSMRTFRKELKSDDDDTPDTTAAASTATDKPADKP